MSPKSRGAAIRLLLSGGDRRSIGRVPDVIASIGQHPAMLSSLVECLRSDDACIRMRAADALEKISRKETGVLQSHKRELLDVLAESCQQEVRWHLAVMVPRLQLTQAECCRVSEILQSYLNDKSSIVKTCAMQGMADLISKCASVRANVIELLRYLTRTGTPAMRARGRKLLRHLEAEDI
jgi:hypothetical protein